MRNVLRLVVGLSMLALWGPQGLQAENAPSKPGLGHRRSFQQRRAAIGRLNLTAQQRQQALEMKESYRKRLSDLRCKLRQKKAERQTEMKQTDPDKEKLQRLSQEIGQIHGQILVEETNARSDFEKILTPQQLEEWKKIRSENPAPKGGEPEDDAP